MKKQSAAGFSLLEMLITLVIITLLITIAYPSYNHHLLRVNRAEGKTALLELAEKLEYYHLQNNTYAGATLNAFNMINPVARGHYHLQIETVAATTFHISATPISTQLQDTVCGRLTLDSLGNKNITGSGTLEECW